MSAPKVSGGLCVVTLVFVLPVMAVAAVKSPDFFTYALCVVAAGCWIGQVASWWQWRKVGRR